MMEPSVDSPPQVTQTGFVLPDIPVEEAGGQLTIDLGALATNWRLLRDRAQPAECSAVVKANAYGIGIEQAVPALWNAGCRTFFVAVLSEAKRVRQSAPEAIIYVLNGMPPRTAPVYAAHQLRPVLGSLDEIQEWTDFTSNGGVSLGAALHVDTGLNRLGIRPEEAIAWANSGRGNGIRPTLLISHFVSSEEPHNLLNRRQIECFLNVQRHVDAEAVSLCNSSGFFLDARPYMNLARPGFALYGGNPTPGQPNPMRHVVTLEARIVQVRQVPDGETVGYNSKWTAKGERRIAVLSVGYADGLTRHLSAGDDKRGGYAHIAGTQCAFAGRVSMDLITVDITHLPEGVVSRGDFAQLLGPEISVDDMAERGDTNGYEILTSLGRRYARRYIGH